MLLAEYMDISEINVLKDRYILHIVLFLNFEHMVHACGFGCDVLLCCVGGSLTQRYWALISQALSE